MAPRPLTWLGIREGHRKVTRFKLSGSTENKGKMWSKHDGSLTSKTLPPTHKSTTLPPFSTLQHPAGVGAQWLEVLLGFLRAFSDRVLKIWPVTTGFPSVSEAAQDAQLRAKVALLGQGDHCVPLGSRGAKMGDTQSNPWQGSGATTETQDSSQPNLCPQQPGITGHHTKRPGKARQGRESRVPLQLLST